MLVLGWFGDMLELPYLDLREFDYGGITHDAAAVLVDDGKVVAAIEEERLSRIKHTGKAPVHAINFCLDSYGVKFSDIDKFVYPAREQESNVDAKNKFSKYADINVQTARDLLQSIIYKNFGVEFGREDICFVEHHMCHAASAFYMSGFRESLVLTLDGDSPEAFAGYVVSAEGDGFKVLERIPNTLSLGSFYITVIEFLGYLPHDEYKVMGLAPYGDPRRYRDIFSRLYTLLPGGKFAIHTRHVTLLRDLVTPRLKGEGFTREHKDLAAALQEALETIVLHILEYYRKETGHTHLCMAGGVTHNCSMNGKVLYSGLFDEVFVQPAAHDAGNALGGALYVSKTLNPQMKMQKLRHLYWGSDTGGNESVQALLEKWDSFVDFSREDDITSVTARLLSEGNVTGWVQGRSEFGPRALGNRSILADPRPAENKTIINAMVKKREGYRPFAPSVLEEYLDEYYEVPQCTAPFDYMNFVLRTKEEKQESLGAVTHVDGTARVQSVCRTTNKKYWELIDAFRKLTGIPILLNTSFNNNVEPIVNSEEDAIVCFLTTRIHYLVIGDYLVSKKQVCNRDYLIMTMKRPLGSELEKVIDSAADGNSRCTYKIRLHFGDKYCTTVPEKVFTLLEKCNGSKTLDVLFTESGIPEEEYGETIDEILRLWSLRLIILAPRDHK